MINKLPPAPIRPPDEGGDFTLSVEYARAAAVYLGALPQSIAQFRAMVESLALSAQSVTVAFGKFKRTYQLGAKHRHIHAKAQRRERRVRQYFTLSLTGIL